MTFDNPQEFVEKWVDIFTRDYSYKNPTYARGTLHVILGRILVNQRIVKRGSTTSPRISMFYMQGASSGKSSAYPLVYEVMDNLGIDIKSPDELSDAALVGTVERTTDEEGNEVWEDREGILADTEVFHFDEASVLINPKDYQQNMMNYLQKALNPIDSEQNTITKKLAHGDEIQISPTCSLLLTSYMPEEIVDTILNTGFLQRMLVFPRRLTTNDRKDQINEDIAALGQESNRSDIGELIDEFRGIRRHFEDRREFSWGTSKTSLRKYNRQMIDEVSNTNRQVKKIMESFVPRQIEIMARIALHHTCMRRDSEVKSVDVEYASKLVLKSFYMILNWLEDSQEIKEKTGSSVDNNIDRDRFKKLTKVIKKSEHERDEWIGVNEILDQISHVWDLTNSSCYRQLEKFEEKGWIEKKKEHRSKYIKVTI